ncbi:MAG: dipeptidase [Rubrimonas sp.]|uniref:dipeptidase n=1 Tax=Rubrimonas sp. TaxID=2036015 RepID=UPI002FDD6874
MQPVFDGHNDVLLHLWRARDWDGAQFFAGRGDGHLDLPRARAGGLMGGFFAIYVPEEAPLAEGDEAEGALVDGPPIGPVDAAFARRATHEIAGILLRMVRARPDAIRLCRSAAEIEAAEAAGALAAILHLEGCEAIGPDLGGLEVLHAAGLRSLGPVWSRPNIFGQGVSFRFPGDAEEGGGLTPAGRDLVAACDRLGVMVDLSHLNAAGFRDVARLSSKPLVATHSNVWELSNSSRNLADWQLAAIAESRGVVGLNYAVGFLRADGRKIADTPFETMLRHLDRLVERLGEGGVALGSDFDGAEIPRALADVSGLPRLVEAMRAAGYGEALIRRICRDNWIDLLRRTIG